MQKINAAKKFRDVFSEPSIAHIYNTKILGSRTIGLDRVDSVNFESKLASEIKLVSNKVLLGKYSFTKYKEKLVSKGFGKAPRQLSIPTIRDRLTLKTICEYLFHIFPEAKPNLPQDKIAKLKEIIDTGTYKYYVKIDLQDFYPSIDHKLLYSKIFRKARLGAFKKLISDAVANPTVPETNAKNFSIKTQGVAQGLSISNVLAEIFMMDVEKKISKVDPIFFRFVDDTIILTNEDPTKVCERVCKIFRGAKLKPHPLHAPGSKTQVGSIANGVEFLGYLIKPNKTSVRRSSLINFESSLVGVFTDYKHRLRKAKGQIEKSAAFERFRWNLNLKITGCIYKNQRFGWVFYYSQINDLGVLRQIDNTISLLFKRFKISTPPKPKRTLKAFYESKRIDKDSHWYIPNYDDMTVSKMKIFLTQIGHDVTGSNDVEVSVIFHKLVRRATRSLEQDIASVS